MYIYNIYKEFTMMNLADPELELIDPTPNVHSMFLHFDRTFFWATLSSRCVVRWSKRMYSCAGICSYEGRGGVCDIALSEPLLKLRPRKDLVETLLHEMIHAFLFITCRVQDRDGHGPNFQAHMHRINRAAGLNITIYHDFHDEVKLYQTHWWRCNGPCQAIRPHFGIVRRSANRAPGPSDYWWSSHQRSCGGTFIKIKEPEKPEKQNKKTNIVKPNADITKYITNNNNKDVNNKNIVGNGKPNRPVLKDSSNVHAKPNAGVKNKNRGTLGVPNKRPLFNPKLPKPLVFSGTGGEINGVLETVRNVWANKQFGINNNNNPTSNNKNSPPSPMNINKHNADDPVPAPPPSKMKKIEDYFTATATSMLKDVYGQDFNITVSKNDQKFIAEPNKDSLVDCPVCNYKIKSCIINKHLDECLSRVVIDHLTQHTVPLKIPVTSQSGRIKVKDEKELVGDTINSSIDLFHTRNDNINRKRPRTSFDGNVRKPGDKFVEKDKRKSDSFVVPTKLEQIIPAVSESMPTTMDRPIKIEPGCSNPDLTLGKARPEPIISAVSESMPTTTDRPIKIEPGCSNPDLTLGKECPCCGDKLNKSVDEHLDECLSFFDNDTTIPEEGASTSFTETIVIDDDDDEFDETMTLNATGTKLPCPSCLKMVEEIDMNTHLDTCLV